MSRNELAKYARGVGLRWDTSKVRDFESGRNAPLFATVLLALLALSYATGRDVTLADLLATPDEVAIVLNERIAPLGAKVSAAARGEPLQLDEDDHFSSLLVELLSKTGQYSDVDPVDAVKARSGLDEERLAKRLGISADALAAESLRLWGRAFSDERDRRAGLDANPQKRGRVARILQAELEKALADGDD